MLKKLQAKWKVNAWDLLLILCTFAIGGSLCGWLGRKILLLTALEKNIAWYILYIILVTLLWPICVILVSIPLGQFSFFKNYLAKIKNRMLPGSRNTAMNIAIFASGTGSNTKKIIDHFRNNRNIKVALVVSNRENAGVLQIARDNDIDYLLVNKQLQLDSSDFLVELKSRKIDFIILAGFLLKIPPALIRVFPKRIINIHPALLPAYGGKGMYGRYVHEAVLANKEKQSGISIHYVDEIYDHGEIIFQSACDIETGDNADKLAQKIHSLEHQHYPVVIEGLLKKQKTS